MESIIINLGPVLSECGFCFGYIVILVSPALFLLTFLNRKLTSHVHVVVLEWTEHLIFGGGGRGWDFFEKNSFFPYRSEKNKMSSMRLKIKS